MWPKYSKSWKQCSENCCKIPMLRPHRYLLCFRSKTWFVGPPLDPPMSPEIVKNQCYVDDCLHDRFLEGAWKATRRKVEGSMWPEHIKYICFRSVSIFVKKNGHW